MSPAAALALNAGSFAVSALVVRLGVAERPVPGAPARPVPRWWADARTGLRAVLGDRRRRVLVCAVWLMGCLVLPEALAVPYAEQLGLAATAAGLLMAADPAGSVIWGARGAVALCGTIGAALALVVTRAHLRMPAAGIGGPARAGVVGVRA